jgi:hypothetical protein
VGDFNGDGNLDLAIGVNNAVVVDLGNGTGSFTPAPGSPLPGGEFGEPGSLAVGDFNGDGAPDLVRIDEAGGQALVFLNQSGTTVTVSSSSAAAGFSQPVTFSATVSGTLPGNGVPAGSVTFLDGGVPLATVPLDASGHATLTTTALAAGGHTITARYDGDANFRAAAAAVTVTVADSGDLTPVVSVTPGRFRAGRELVTLRNVSGQVLHGPLWLVLDGLDRRVKVRGLAGRTVNHGTRGSPYVAVALPGNVLAPGGRVTVLLRLVPRPGRKVRFHLVVLAGTGVL